METQHQSEESTKATGRRRDIVIAIDKFVLRLARHWLTWITIITIIYVGVPFLAPVFMELDMPGPANAIYAVYDKLCHQMTFRSWFLFGEQAYYPRERAGLPAGAFEQYVEDDPFYEGVDVHTLDYFLIASAGRFVGNEVMGWKVAYCQRDVAIYGAIAVFGVVYGLLRRLGLKVPPLPFWAYIVFGLIPVGLDGVTQLLANPPYDAFMPAWFPLRESTPFLRTLTGALFGICSAWLAFPYLDESMEEIASEVSRKFERAGIEV